MFSHWSCYTSSASCIGLWMAVLALDFASGQYCNCQPSTAALGPLIGPIRKQRFNNIIIIIIIKYVFSRGGFFVVFITGAAALDPKANGKISLIAFIFIVSTNGLGSAIGLGSTLIFGAGNYLCPIHWKPLTAYCNSYIALEEVLEASHLQNSFPITQWTNKPWKTAHMQWQSKKKTLKRNINT